MAIISDLKKDLFPKGVRHWSKSQLNRVLHKTTEKDFLLAFKELKIQNGSVVCVHAALSGFGYLPSGPTCILTALQKAVPNCTIVMPSFPFSNTTLAYLESGTVFDPSITPSASGALSEALRLLPGTKRSGHPTHPCIALGPQANQLVVGTENAYTPFGENSVYGRFSKLPNAVLLLLHTNSTSYVHRIQEAINWPNLFLPQSGIAKALNSEHKVIEYEIAIHRPTIPLYVIMEGDNAGEIEHLWMPDYVLQFPSLTASHIFAKLRTKKAKTFLSERQNQFLKTGIIRMTRCKEGEIAAINVPLWHDVLSSDMRNSLATFADLYRLENMTRAMDSGLLLQ